MPWPVFNSFVANLQNGITTTLAWGTENENKFYIVKSARAQRMNDEVKVEQGSGLTAIDVIVQDGTQIEVTVIDDVNVIPPDTGSVVHFVNPLNASSAQSAPWSITLRQGFYVIDNSYNMARKQEGERVLLVKAFNAMSALSTEQV